MGLLNWMDSMSNINKLLKDFENEVTITQDLVANGWSVSLIEHHLNVMKDIHQQLINNFAKSSGAQGAAFHIFGKSMLMDEILTYTKNVCLHLSAIVQNRQP